MNGSMQEAGETLIRKSEGILRRDVQGALDEGDFNMVVRRAQEVVELALKGALRMLGADYPKVHDVAPAFSEQVRQKWGAVDVEVLEQMEDISFWLSQARAPSFYLERDYGGEDAQQAFQDAVFVLTEVRKILGMTSALP
ncbi:MAG: HEPN domain-containing protein [Anaerolineae bacterium]